MTGGNKVIRGKTTTQRNRAGFWRQKVIELTCIKLYLNGIHYINVL